MSDKPQQDGRIVKIRQCPIDANLRDLMAINDLGGWRGSMLTPRNGCKNTTAILNAPSVEEAEKLLEKGYVVENGKVLAVVPGNSSPQEENLRTVLLVGVNKVNEAQKKMGGKLIELGLFKALHNAGCPIQALKLVDLEGDRIRHSAYVLIRKAEYIQDLQPIKDTTSGVTLKWTSLDNHGKICAKCLSWSEHEDTCPKHEKNKHRYINAKEIAKRALEGGSILLERFKKLKRQVDMLDGEKENDPSCSPNTSF